MYSKLFFLWYFLYANKSYEMVDCRRLVYVFSLSNANSSGTFSSLTGNFVFSIPSHRVFIRFVYVVEHK